MKITTSEKDHYSSSEILYQPSLCFQVVAEEFKFSQKNKIEKDKNTMEKMEKSISLFIDMLEIVNMHNSTSTACFYKAIEGLIEGMIIDITDYYEEDYNENCIDNRSLEEKPTHLKKMIYMFREYDVRQSREKK